MDYYFDLHVTRDKVASSLVNDLEQTPYVFAQVASDIGTSSHTFTEFCTLAHELDEDDKTALQLFCAAVSNALLPDDEGETS